VAVSGIKTRNVQGEEGKKEPEGLEGRAIDRKMTKGGKGILKILLSRKKSSTLHEGKRGGGK